MTLTTPNLTIELSPGSFYASRGIWGVHIHRDPAFSFWEFDKLNSDGSVHLWGFGRHCVLSWSDVRK